MQPIERSPERDAAITAMLPLVPTQGWTLATLRHALTEPEDASLLFPGGIVDVIEAWLDLTDRQMEQAALGAEISGLGLTKRVRAVVALRFALLRGHREAVRRALAVTVLHPSLAARTAARTVDSIWYAAGDRSADFSWYTKRALLAGIYSLTLLFWLRDSGDDDAKTLEFLDRRLAGIGRIGKARARLTALFKRSRPALT